MQQILGNSIPTWLKEVVDTISKRTGKNYEIEFHGNVNESVDFDKLKIKFKIKILENSFNATHTITTLNNLTPIQVRAAELHKEDIVDMIKCLRNNTIKTTPYNVTEYSTCSISQLADYSVGHSVLLSVYLGGDRHSAHSITWRYFSNELIRLLKE